MQNPTSEAQTPRSISLQEIAEHITQFMCGRPWTVNLIELEKSYVKAKIAELQQEIANLTGGVEMGITCYKSNVGTPISIIMFHPLAEHKRRTCIQVEAIDLTNHLVAAYFTTREMRPMWQHISEIRHICRGS